MTSRGKQEDGSTSGAAGHVGEGEAMSRISLERLADMRGFLPGIEIAADSTMPTMQFSAVDEISTLPVYDLLNGDANFVHPYLQRSTVEMAYKWVPVANVPSEGAIKVVDAYIKSHRYHLTVHRPRGWTDGRIKKVAIILGTARAVMHANFGLGRGSFIEKELVDPVLQAQWATNGTPSFRVRAPAPAAGDTEDQMLAMSYFNTALDLDADETDFMKCIVKMAPAIPPIQGHNLLVDGHHYLSDVGKNSFRAFLAVENQVMVPEKAKTIWESDLDEFRNALWHKSGHPISIDIKLQAATSHTVKSALDKMGLGSASVRLPALESEGRAASSYLKVCSTVGSKLQRFGCKVDYSVLHNALEYLYQFPYGVQVPRDGLEGPENMRCASRAEALDYLKKVVTRNQEHVATMYGFYQAELRSARESSETRVRDTIGKAYSLNKLQTECLTSYHEGLDMYKDLTSAKNKARAAGKFNATDFIFK